MRLAVAAFGVLTLEPAGGGDDCIGIARYSNGRRFEVTTESVVAVPDSSSPR